MAEGKTFRLKWENYKEQCASHWPSIGKHILAQYDRDYIVVYQAFCPDIADYAVKHGKFGGMRYSFTRMTWIKTNFLWMMYRSNWAQKKNQNRILAIYLSIEGFDQILKFSRGNGIRPEGRTPGNVRIQWDPDHDPKGVNQRRRAVQLGIKGIPLERFHEQYIQHIEDITDMVHEQRQHVLKNELHKLQTPAERVYTPSDVSICRHILLDEFQDRTGEAKGKVTADDFKDSDNTDEERSERSDLDEHDKPCGKELQYTTCTKPVFAGDKVDLIVCLGGSFNPVHVGHIQMLDSAVKWLSNMANYNVVAARLAVAPDSYVEKKCKRKGDRCIKAEHRIKLCELACSGQKLIKTHFTTTHSARNCGENVKKWENFKNAKVAVVIGADKAAFSNGHWKWKAKSKCLTVCVGRKGETEAVRKAYAEEFKEDLVTNPDFIMIEDEIDNINSTEIRQQLSGTEYDMKYGVNNQTNKEIISNPSTMKEHSSYKNMTDESLNDQENRKVPSSCDELPDEELESMNLKDDYTAISEGNVGAKINEENIPLSWEEIETVDDLPAACNSPKSDLNIHKDKNSSLEQEKYGARFKTRYSGSIDLKETVNELNDQDQSTDKHSRKYVIDNLVSNGWLAKPVGDYMLEKFFDLYL